MTPQVLIIVLLGAVVGGAIALLVFALTTPATTTVAEPRSASPTVSDGLLDDPPTAAEHQADQKIYTVKAPRDGYHDNLWDIAEKHLGDRLRFHEIFELNQDKVQVDGRRIDLTRLIQPGWELVLPDDAVGVEPIGSTPDQAPAGVADDCTTQSTLAEDVGDWAGGSGLLAASMLDAVLLHRRRRLGRTPGEDARSIEADLRVAATTDRSVWLNVALRRLTVACRRAGVVPPSAYAVLLSDDSVELLLSLSAPDGVDGWTVHDEGGRWTCERTEDVRCPNDVPAYPTLVSIGVDTEDRDVLLDLEAAGGVVAIDGDLAVAEQVASSIAVQAITAPWSDTLEVTASHLPHAILDLGLERLTMVEDLADELDGIERHVQALPADVLHGRVSRRSPMPARLVVSGALPSSSVVDRLGLLAGNGPRSLSVVVVGEHAAACWRLRVDERGNLEVPQLGLSTVANRLGSAQLDAVAELFTASREPARVVRKRVALQRLGRDGDDAAWATAQHRVAVVGRVEVHGVEVAADTCTDQSTEIVTYLALRPKGVQLTELSAAVWPRGVTADALETAIERAREWLGPDVDGTDLLRTDADGRLSLAESVVCDWHAVSSLLRASRRATSLGVETDLLRRALGLVRGEPFDGVPGGRYAWVARDDLPRSIATAVVDGAERLVQVLGGDPDGAAHAAATGLLVAPGHQPLWRALLRTRHASEGTAGVHRTLGEMSSSLRGTTLDAETEALVEEFLPSAPDAAEADG